MEKIKTIIKKVNIENILCFFIILTPILDIISFLFRKAYNTNFSISTFARPIIPIIVAIYIFIKSKYKKKIVIVGIVYALYGIAHLWIYKNNIMGCSFGTVIQEARYIANYTFMILILFIYLEAFYRKSNKKIINSVLISNATYILSIFIAILSKTSSSSYIEGIGYKGWFESANSVGSVLIFFTIIILSQIEKNLDIKSKVISIIILILNGIYLTTLIGTRVGLIGFVLVLITYVILYIICTVLKKSNINKKTIFIISAVLIGLIILVICVGSNTINRRKKISELGTQVIDETTNQETHITGDLNNIYLKIKNEQLQDEFMTQPQKQAIVDLHNWADKQNLKNTDTRMQQLIYNVSLIKNQKNIILIALGNGYLINTNELVLEMELIAFPLNFGIVGMVLYLGGFISIFIYSIIQTLKNFKKIDIELCMLLVGNGLSYVLSTLAGYTFFNPSSMLIIVIMNVCLLNKIMEIRGENHKKDSIWNN